MLTRLRIKGFKSFADPIDLEFGPGLNVIVGPNGSGKSNISEAIAWALGEQRAGRLRAPAMQDILFSGGDGRQPVGMAEVVLTLDGPAGDGPAEMGVSRRLTRAGDSGYRLNGSNARLVDVLDALSTRGLGPQSLSIIRQGQVDAICQSKPSALRAILDEAAGTGLPKRRRHRAELRLKHVDEHLARARDLAAELASRARSLERQARAAERAAEVERDLAQAREALIRARAVAAAREMADARGARAECAAAVSRAQQALATARAHAAEAERRRSAAVAEREAAVQSAAGLRAVAERVSGRAEVATGRVEAAAEEAARRREMREEAARALVAAEAAASEIAHSVARAEQDAARASERLEQAEAVLTSAAAALESARDHRRAVERDAAERAAVEARIARAVEAISEIDGEDAPDPVRAERRAGISRARRERDADARADAGRAADAARSAREGVAGRAARLAAEAAALAPTDDRQADAVLLGDGIEVCDGMERAVAAALGELADAPLVDSVPEGARALDEGASAAAVARPAGAAAPSVAPVPGARPLAEVITACPARSRPWLDGLLADAWLVPSLEGIPAGVRARVLVTADGLAFRPGLGMLTGVRGPWAGRALHRRAIEAAERAAAQVDGAEEAERVAVAAARRADTRARASERCAERAEARLQSALAEQRRRDAARAEAVAALDAARAEMARLGAAPVQAGDDPQMAEEAARAAREARDAAREASRVAGAALAEERARHEDVVARRARARAEAEAPEPALANHSGVLAAARAMDAVAHALAPRADEMDARSRELADGIAAAATDARAALGAVEAAERVAAQAGEADRAAEVGMAVAVERAREAGVAEDAPAPPPPSDDEESADVIAERVEALAMRREGMGAVNPLAAEERAELAEREAEATEQIADLEASAEALRAQMSELDAQVAGGFAEVMQAVDERFQEVVGLLFPGGTGRLRIVDDEGEEGVEVEVVPAGKRARSLALFSGGEKSLIALAFCLAIAMARPTPFYLLDEVEAALDDANLRRFLGVLRRLAGERQFILITHQQPTVEVADLLFGVTMGRSGVSQVVARRLDRDAEGPARPWVRRQLSEVRPNDAPAAQAG